MNPNSYPHKIKHLAITLNLYKLSGYLGKTFPLQEQKTIKFILFLTYERTFGRTHTSKNFGGLHKSATFGGQTRCSDHPNQKWGDSFLDFLGATWNRKNYVGQHHSDRK